MSHGMVLSIDDQKLIEKLRHIKNSYENLSIDEKKKYCIIGNQRRLENLHSQHLFQTRDNKTVLKPQWFHSAAAIYVLLTHSQLINEQSSWAYSLLLPTKATFIKIAQDVLNSDPDGVEYMRILAQVKLTVDFASNTISYELKESEK